MQSAIERDGSIREAQRRIHLQPKKRYKRLQDGPLYVYLCSGEVKVVPHAGSVRLRRGTLRVFCADCRTSLSFLRQDVYSCSRLAGGPPQVTD